MTIVFGGGSQTYATAVASFEVVFYGFA